MAWQLRAYTLLGFVAAIISGSLALQAWNHRDQRGALPFVGLMVALGVWSLFSAIQLGYTTKSEQLLWHRLGLAAGGTIPTLWLAFTLQYAGRDEWLTRPRKSMLALEPLLFALLVVTNPAHGQMWDSATLVTAAGGDATLLSLGPGYYLHIVYAYLLIGIGLGLLALVFSDGSRAYRTQAALLILGTLPPTIGNVAFTLGLSVGPVPAVDPTPFAFVITGVLFGLALFRFDLLERTPIARQRALDAMGDGLVVFDEDGQVVHANAVAQQVLDPSPTVDRSITVIADAETTRDALTTLDGETVTATLDGRERAYDLDLTQLHGHRQDSFGHVLALRDVTERESYEQRLEVAQRVLRHNLRNDMSVIQGNASYLARTAEDGQLESVQRIIDTADDLVDLTEKTRTMVRMAEIATADEVTLDAADLLAELCVEFRTEYPAVTIETEFPRTAPISLPDSQFLTVPVRNLVENAIEHSESTEPWVRVTIEQSSGAIDIAVEDRCQTIPEVERKVLFRGSEGPIEHGSGIGLWLTYWSVSTVGGEVSFEDSEDGNVVTLSYRVDSPTLDAA